MVETDIANCFEAIPKDRLIQAAKERVCDQSVLTLLRVVLGAGVMADGVVRRSVTGTQQGGLPYAPNAMGNFCFEVTLGYRRVERGR